MKEQAAEGQRYQTRNGASKEQGREWQKKPKMRQCACEQRRRLQVALLPPSARYSSQHASVEELYALCAVEAKA